MPEAARLRELAAWYREFAERTANPTVWEARLRTADDLEAEAARVDRLVAERIPANRRTAQACH